jgi:hypothetical protein
MSTSSTTFLTQTIKTLTEENQSLASAVSELNQQARNKQDEITALLAQIGQFKQNESAGETKKLFEFMAVQGLNETISRLDAANKKLVSEKDVLQQANATLLSEKDALEEVTGGSASMLKELATEKLDLKEANKTLVSEKADLQKANTRLKIGAFTVAFVAGGIIAAMKTGAVEPTVASIKALLRR